MKTIQQKIKKFITLFELPWEVNLHGYQIGTDTDA